MSVDAWITVAVLAMAFAMLASDRMAPSAVVLSATALLLLANVITTEQALSGFSNPAPITVAALYVVARGAQKTGLLAPLTSRLLGEGRSWRDLARLVVPAAGASAVLNNTPLVAALVPDVVAACQRRGISASKFLMPLSFATILGGTVTVLGTSTNLVVSGLVQEADGRPLGLFEVTPIGLPTAIAGLLVLVSVSWWLVPDRVAVADQDDRESREFVVAMEVVADGPLAGQRIGETDLVAREHVFLVQLLRDGHRQSPVDLDVVLEAGDRLSFVGRVDRVVDLHRLPGLRSTASHHLETLAGRSRQLQVAVIGRTSPAAGHTLAEVDFLSRYQAAVLAVHRDGHRLVAEPREVRLRPGDALMLLADRDFADTWRDRRDFLVIAPLGGDPPEVSRRAPLVGLVMLGMVAAATTGVATVLEAALVASAVLVATGVLTAHEVRDAIDLDVIILIAASFGLGQAVQVTGLADRLAGALVSAFNGFGTYGIVFGILLSLTLLTELVTNNAAVVVVFPVGAAIAAREGIDLRHLAVGLAVAASSSFLTPIGYQTNTIVYGPGGYRFTDYLRVGLPLNLTVLVVATVLVVRG